MYQFGGHLAEMTWRRACGNMHCFHFNDGCYFQCVFTAPKWPKMCQPYSLTHSLDQILFSVHSV